MELLWLLIYLLFMEKWFFRIGFVLQKGLMLISQINQNKCTICYFRYFLDSGYKYVLEVCNGCYDLLMMAFGLKILQVIAYKNMNFSTNKTSIVVIEEGAFGDILETFILMLMEGGIESHANIFMD